MNHINDLLAEWNGLLRTYREEARKMMSDTECRRHGGLTKKDKTTVDAKFEHLHCIIRTKIAMLDPTLEPLVGSVPSIDIDYAWLWRDYVDMYCNHYEIVIEKVKKIISKTEK